jgi:hypothetical protein
MRIKYVKKRSDYFIYNNWYNYITILSSIYYIKNSLVKTKTIVSIEKTFKFSPDINSIKKHVENCLEKVSEKGI